MENLMLFDWQDYKQVQLCLIFRPIICLFVIQIWLHNIPLDKQPALTAILLFTCLKGYSITDSHAWSCFWGIE